MLRFARSRPTQATAVDDLTVEVAVVRDGHVGRAATNATDADALRDVRRAAAAPPRPPPGPRGQGAYPGFPAAGAAPHDGYDPETARLDPARAARR